MLLLQARLDQGEVAMNEYSAFPKASALLGPHQIVLCHILDTRWRSLTLLQRRVGVFYSASQQGNALIEKSLEENEISEFKPSLGGLSDWS